MNILKGNSLFSGRITRNGMFAEGAVHEFHLPSGPYLLGASSGQETWRLRSPSLDRVPWIYTMLNLQELLQYVPGIYGVLNPQELLEQSTLGEL